MKSEGQCSSGGPLTVPGIKPPREPVVHGTPTALERLQREGDKKK